MAYFTNLLSNVAKEISMSPGDVYPEHQNVGLCRMEGIGTFRTHILDFT